MKSVFQIGLLVYLGLGLYLYLMQRSFIYFPVSKSAAVTKERLFSYEGNSIKVSVLNENKKQAIIYFGGNAENVQYNLRAFSDLFPEHTVYLVNYRGYGGSDGVPTEEGIYSDALFVYDEVMKDFKAVSIVGRSLGSAVATYVASKRNIDKLVLVTPFDSVQSVAQSQFPIYPMSIMLKDKHDSFGRVHDIKAQTLIIAAEKDQVIKMRHTQRLLGAFGSDVLFYVIEGADHNNISVNPQYSQIINEFFYVHD